MINIDMIEKLLNTGYNCVEVRSNSYGNKNPDTGFNMIFKKDNKYQDFNVVVTEKNKVNTLLKKYRQMFELE
ncbi:hypothetical protein Q5O24_14045 [Eubacteriaceae bacterium ES3]|nr:hypothetical protein Q5O24_14045 [Eubacteriaceae bacterium ES3]